MKIQCESCGKQFNRNKYQVNRARNNFCSKECHNTYRQQRESRVCLNCRSIFSRKKSSKDVICSWKCRQEYRIGENHWEYKRGSVHRTSVYRRIVAKYGRPVKCDACESTKYVHWHHKDKDTLNNDRSNLTQLCARCHQYLHMIERSRKYFTRINYDVDKTLSFIKG